MALLAVLFGGAGGPGAGASGPPQDGLPQSGPRLAKAKGEACVKDRAWMRRNHMDFLKHRRDETVRDGVRVRDESLLNCQSCHTSRTEFCDRCHSFVGVQPDCFHCHNYK
nr:Hdr-like menaquinol oxidoreductase subunit [uncultured bacterium]